MKVARSSWRGSGVLGLMITGANSATSIDNLNWVASVISDSRQSISDTLVSKQPIKSDRFISCVTRLTGS